MEISSASWHCCFSRKAAADSDRVLMQRSGTSRSPTPDEPKQGARPQWRSERDLTTSLARLVFSSAWFLVRQFFEKGLASQFADDPEPRNQQEYLYTGAPESRSLEAQGFPDYSRRRSRSLRVSPDLRENRTTPRRSTK
jgi:hypothetical protein